MIILCIRFNSSANIAASLNQPHMKNCLVLLLTVCMSTASYAYEPNASYDTPLPELMPVEEVALKYAKEGAYEMNGKSCARALTYGHPTVQDEHDLSKLTISSTQLHAMHVQNGRRCNCIGNRTSELLDDLPRQYQTKENIKLFLYNTMAYMSLKHLKYQVWGGQVDGLDYTNQRYWVENVADYCEIPVEGLPLVTF